MAKIGVIKIFIYQLTKSLLSGVVTISNASLLLATELENANVALPIIHKVIAESLKFNMKSAKELLSLIGARPEQIETMREFSRVSPENERQLNSIVKRLERKCFENACSIFKEIRNQIEDVVTKIKFDDSSRCILLTSRDEYAKILISSMTHIGLNVKSNKNVLTLQKISTTNQSLVLAAFKSARVSLQAHQKKAESAKPEASDIDCESDADDFSMPTVTYSHKQALKRNPNSKRALKFLRQIKRQEWWRLQHLRWLKSS